MNTFLKLLQDHLKGLMKMVAIYRLQPVKQPVLNNPGLDLYRNKWQAGGNLRQN